ncbi:MAG: hypothetical protein MUC36_16390 [Planctomycetes bacterium]|jgi:hypothetical protein|nr:hypothetical protein [Planctomycetota bacterium]
MPSDQCNGSPAARGLLEASACGAILLALTGGAAAAVRLSVDLVQLLFKFAVVLPS